MMKRGFFNKLMLVAALFFSVIWSTSCQKDSENTRQTVVVTGVVLDYFENPVAGAMVSIDGISDPVVTDASGQYRISDVPVVNTQAVMTVRSDNYPEKSVSLIPKPTGDYCYCDVVLNIITKIQGRVMRTEGSYQDGTITPFENVEVILGDKKTFTGSDGRYSFENTEISDRILQCCASGYPSVTVEVNATMYDPVTGISVPDIIMANSHLFPGMTLEQIRTADVWYYNEYKGGFKNDNSITDRGVAYMSVFDFHGSWQESNDGIIVKKTDNGSQPVDLDDFYSYFIGRKMITEDNCILTLNMKCAGAETEGVINLNYGVQIMNLDAESPTIEYIGQRNRICNENKTYTDAVFDLSAYKGHEIAIGIGVYCADAGEHAWKQLIIKKMTFASAVSVGTGYAADLGSGDIEGLKGWHMSAEMVRSTMLNPQRSSTGIPPTGLQYGQVDGYHALRGTGHLATNWAVQYVNAAPEVIVGQGFLMKCRDIAPVNLNVPEMYIYSKYRIGAGSNKITFTIGGIFSKYNAPVYLKLIAIREDGTHEPIAVAESTCGALEAGNNCCKVPFKGNLVYDLSKFNGQNIVVVFGIFQGEYDSAKKEQHRFALARITLE